MDRLKEGKIKISLGHNRCLLRMNFTEMNESQTAQLRDDILEKDILHHFFKKKYSLNGRDP